MNSLLSDLFLIVINMSIAAGGLASAVLILRLFLKKGPRWIHVLLWGLVAIRLICPFSIESPLSLMPDSVAGGDLISQWTASYIGDIDIYHPSSVYYDAAVGAGREPIYDGESGYYVVTEHDQLGEPATVENTVIPVLSAAWAAGMAVLAFYAVISWHRLRRRLDTAVLFSYNIFQSENVPSPIVLGILRPKIYLPFRINPQDMEYVIAHEQTHIRRRDHWWKPLGFFLLTIHWFNPLIWLSYALFCRDIELACDEKVIRELDKEQRAGYSRALLACSVNHRKIAACPLAFGEVSVKERIKSIMNYRRPAFWTVILAVISCAALAIFFLTDPVSSADSGQMSQQMKEEKWDRIPMVMIDGEIYLDTGYNNNSMKKCGTFDGEITSEVDGSESPSADGQSNFGTGYGYQYGAEEGTVELFMNGKWRIFATEETRQKMQSETLKKEAEGTTGSAAAVTVIHLMTSEEKTITSGTDLKIIYSLFSSEHWPEGTSDCLNDFKVAVNGKIYYYHSDCGTINDNHNNRSMTLTLTQKSEVDRIFAGLMTKEVAENEPEN